MYICIDDIIDAAFEQQDSVKLLFGPGSSSFVEEKICSKLFLLETAERANEILSKKEKLARLERKRLSRFEIYHCFRRATRSNQRIIRVWFQNVCNLIY